MKNMKGIWPVNKRPLKVGFTLVEMLVVITIIGILAGLSIPVIGAVQQKAAQAQSASNLRQIGIGLQALISEGAPILGVGSFPSHDGYTESWAVYTWMDLVGLQLGFVEQEGNQFVYKVDPKKSIFQNPAKKSADGMDNKYFDPTNQATQARTASYGYNLRLGPHSHPNAISDLGHFYTPGRGLRLAMVRKPSDLVVVAESAGDGIWDHQLNPQHPNFMPMSDNRGGARAVFADGHVEWMPVERPAGGSEESRYFTRPDGSGGHYYFNPAPGELLQ